MLNYQGYGRHTAEEVLQIAKDDLSALENFISNKKYLFGENPCVEDAVVFSYTCQIFFIDRSPLHDYFKSKLILYLQKFILVILLIIII